MKSSHTCLQKFLLDVVLNIPDQVLLPEDACQRIKYSAKAQKKILKDIETMKLEILAVSVDCYKCFF